MNSNSDDATDRTRVVRLLPLLDYGGVEECTATLARQVDRTQFDFRVCTFRKAGHIADVIREMGIPVDVLGVDPAVRNLGATRALYGYLRETAPEIVHAAIAEANFHAAIAGRAAGVPVLVGEEVGTPTRSIPARLVFGLVHRLLHRTIGVSRATCANLVSEQFAPRDRVELVYNPVDGSFFDLDPQPGDDGETFRILTVGRLVEQKNFGGLLEAFEILSRRHEDVELQIAGDGPLEDELRARIEELDLDNEVDLLGFRDDVGQLLERAHLFVLPSVSEGYGIALVEAMAAGLPVLGSTAGGIPEVMDDLADEWTVPPSDYRGWADAIERVVEMSVDRRRAFGERSRSIASRRFAPEDYARNVETLYAELLEETGYKS